MKHVTQPKRPPWLKIRVPAHEDRNGMFAMMQSLSLHTVCEEANCPNLAECFGRKTATFMILGRNCTRNCSFCNVAHRGTDAVDADEPENVARAVFGLKLKFVVITSVTRDDLPDGGAAHFAETIRRVRLQNPETGIEVLIPDFKGDGQALDVVLEAKPDILAHNIETVPELYPEMRAMADYGRSLELLRRAAAAGRVRVKSGIMLGVGETEEQVMATLKDLRAAGCDILSIGQYLAPSAAHHPVVEYVAPEQFIVWRDRAVAMGFSHVASGPLVRSSYHAEEAVTDRHPV